MIALDASVLVAHFDKRDEHSATSTQLLDDAAGEALIVHSVTLAEVLLAAVRGGKEAQLLSDLGAIGVQTAAPSAEEPLRLARLRVLTRLKLPDCCVLETALNQRARLATFDGALAGAARDLGVVVLGTS